MINNPDNMQMDIEIRDCPMKKSAIKGLKYIVFYYLENIIKRPPKKVTKET